MTVVQSYINEIHYKEVPKWERLNERTREIMSLLISINSSYSSQVVPPKQATATASGGEITGQMDQLGNKTECALLGFLLGLGQNYQRMRDEFPEEKIFKVRGFKFLKL